MSFYARFPLMGIFAFIHKTGAMHQVIITIIEDVLNSPLSRFLYFIPLIITKKL